MLLCLVWVNDHYPVADWLAWRLLQLWGASALLHAGCVATGYLVLTRVLRLRGLPRLETLVVSMTVGLVAFVMAMYVAGALACFTPALSILLPVAMLALGAPAAIADRATARLHGKLANTGSDDPPTRRPTIVLGRLETLVLVGGLFGLALVYLQCMTPSALNYDARWYHLSVAEDYAREGRIVPFLADYNRAYPQLTALLHTWAWLVPGLDFTLRCMLALHTEFFLFVWTLVGVSAGVAWLVDNRRSSLATGMAFFLFPVIVVYDCNIGGSADRVLAFFSPALFLAAARTARDHALSPRWMALVGIVAAGAVLTKYQAVFVLVPIGVIVGGGWLRALIHKRLIHKRSMRARDWLAPAALVGAAGLLVLPHFLKNWIFYRNPIYPFENALFPGWPRVPDTAMLWGKINLSDVTPRGTLPERLLNAGKGLLKLPFRSPYVFGFAFSLLVPVLPFLRRAGRIWLCVLASALATLTWGYMVVPHDRYAQAFLPLLVMVAAAIIVRAWRLGRIARMGVFALVATQVVWSGDVYFFSTGADRMADALKLIRSGLDGKAKTRFDGYLGAERAISRRLPIDAVVLLHYTRLSLGMDRRVLQDLPSFQGLITTREVHSARELWGLYRSYGITHVAHEYAVWPAFTKQEEVVFGALRAHIAKGFFREGIYEVFELPKDAPAAEQPYKVLTLGIGGYADGVYPVQDLGTYDNLPDEDKHYPSPTTAVAREKAGEASIVNQVDAVLVSNDFGQPEALRDKLGKQFQSVVTYREHASFTLHVRSARPEEKP